MGYRENARVQQAQDDAYRRHYQQYREAAQQQPDRTHKTKTAICQIFYNRMDITDMDQMSPDGPYEVY